MNLFTLSLYRVVLLSILSLGVWSVLSVPIVAATEKIDSFSVVYTIASDGVVTVVETIVYDFGTTDRRGIIRTLSGQPPQSSVAWYRTRSVPIRVLSVVRNNVAEPYLVTRRGLEYDIKIGNPDRFLQGIQRYTITYTLTSPFAHGPAGVEFYWNVTGNDWIVPMGNIEALVRAPVGTLEQASACYVGSIGSTERCQIEVSAEGSEVLFRTTILYPREGVTIAQALMPEATFLTSYEPLAWWVFVSPLLLVLYGILAVKLYRYVIARRPNRAIIAEYVPYQQLPALEIGTLFDGQLDSRDIAAGLLQVAQQGHLSITMQPKSGMFDRDDYCFRLNTTITDLPHRYDADLLTLIFGNRSVGSEVWLSELLQNQSQRAKNAATFFVLRSSIRDDLRARGYFEAAPSFFTTIGLYLSLVGLPFGFPTAVAITSDWLLASVLGIILTLGMSAWFATYISYRRTKQGYVALWHIRGFKRYLEVAEADRMTFHNAPEKNPQEFLEWLPYAVAFGVETKWAEVFAGMTIPTPDWFQTTDQTTFNPALLAERMHSFSSLTRTIHVAPAQSGGSSGRTGSSGGGFSGGGGGGGGGRSW